MPNTPMSVLAIIPARGGSKGVPLKNIRQVGGKPLIAWTIQTALASPSLDRTVVSTNDEQIAQIAINYGAEVPFLRPVELAQDDTPGIEPIIHAVRWLEQHQDYHPECVMVLQPTSPLRTARDIEAALQLAQERQADGVVSVCPVLQHPYWMKKVIDDGRLIDFLPLDRVYSLRQDLPPAYALNGAIYLVRRRALLEQRTYYNAHTYAYIMPSERSLDIDTPWDLHLADLILRDGAKRERD